MYITTNIFTFNNNNDKQYFNGICTSDLMAMRVIWDKSQNCVISQAKQGSCNFVK